MVGKRSKRVLQWQEKYDQLRAYIAEHRHLPGKKKVEKRALLNWWKYNKRLVKQGRMDDERLALLRELSEMRELKDNEGMLFRTSI